MLLLGDTGKNYRLVRSLHSEAVSAVMLLLLFSRTEADLQSDFFVLRRLLLENTGKNYRQVSSLS